MPNHLTTEVQDLGQPIGVRIDQDIADGGIVLGNAPGSGITIDEAMIEQLPAGQGWATPAGPHVRPERAGLRMIPDEPGTPGVKGWLDA